MKTYSKFLLLSALFPIAASAQETPQYLVLPYLQWATQTTIDVKWETDMPATGWVEYGAAQFNAKAPNLSHKTQISDSKSFHTAHLKGLTAETEYFYRTVNVVPGKDTLYSNVYPFKTAVKEDTPIAFSVFSDTQGRPNPNVWGKIATLAELERPNFAIHAGDQVDRGRRTSDWVGQFLPQGQPYMSKYNMYATLGNHEGDAENFHKYLGHPEKKRVFTVTYGNTQIIFLDSNQDMKVGGQYYKELEAELAKATGKWIIITHHHCIYSSDNNDHGDTQFAKSTLGIPRLSHLPALYEKYNVDLVFYGHVHTYERTWPLKDDKVDHKKGVVYVQIGGSGGGLENHAPLRSWFTNKVYYGHHFGNVKIAGDQLQFQAINLDGQIIDQFEISKASK